MALDQCPRCDGFTVPGWASCPNCSKPLSGPRTEDACSVQRVAVDAAKLAAGFVTAVTLMACYGLSVCQNEVDEDRDGFVACKGPGEVNPARADCNDKDASIHPGAPDPVGDHIDQDCNDVDGPTSSTPLSASPANSTSKPSAVPATNSASASPRP